MAARFEAWGVFTRLPALVLAVAAWLMASPGVTASPRPEGQDMLDRRAKEAVEVLRGGSGHAAIFNDRFLAAVPPRDLRALGRRLEADNGRIIDAGQLDAEGHYQGSFIIRFARGQARARLTLEPQAPFRISGFKIAPAIPRDDGPERIAADFAALPGHAGFAVAKLGDGAPAMLLARDADRQFAIGSAFKLWVLDALAQDVAADRRRWDEVVPLGPSSLPGGITQDWPKGAPVTVATLATLMISLSDNTATDTLIGLIGRERIGERIRATGHSDPARALPLLTTAEAFALKLGPAAIRDAYAQADAAGRARLLAGLDAAAVLRSSDPIALDGKPVAIESVEWFASPADIVGVLDALVRRPDRHALDILGVTENLDPALRRSFAYAGYKGGSEAGVLDLTWLLQSRAGAFFVVTASWNDPSAPLDGARLETLALRLVEYLAARP